MTTDQSAGTMRRALCPVERYNERLNRARSARSMISKLPEKSSPAPRSPAKERPVRESERAKRKLEDKCKADPSSPVSSFNSEFDTTAGIKMNPFLMADRKAKAPAKAPVLPKKKVPPLAPPPPPEPRPIGDLTDEQRAGISAKRNSISARRNSVAQPQPQMQQLEEAVDAAPAEDDANERKADGHLVDIEHEVECGVAVAPVDAASVKAAPKKMSQEETAEPSGATAGDVTLAAAAAAANPAPIMAPAAVPARLAGDLDFLRAGTAQQELLAAVSLMLPLLDSELNSARAAEATAEPLLEVVRRCQRTGKGKRLRR